MVDLLGVVRIVTDPLPAPSSVTLGGARLLVDGRKGLMSGL
jgi:hypothetical protein